MSSSRPSGLTIGVLAWLVGTALCVGPSHAGTQPQMLDDFHAGGPGDSALGWEALGVNASAKLSWVSTRPGSLAVAYQFERADGLLYLMRGARLRAKPVNLEMTVKGNGERVSVVLASAATGVMVEYPGPEPVKSPGWNTMAFSLHNPALKYGTGGLDALPGGGGISLQMLLIRPKDDQLTGTLEFREIVAAEEVKDDQAAMIDLVANRWDNVYVAGETPVLQAQVSTVSDNPSRYKVNYTIVDADGRDCGTGEQTSEVRSGDLLRVPLAFKPVQPLGHFTARATVEGGPSKRAATLRFCVLPKVEEGPGRRLGVELDKLHPGPLHEWYDPLMLKLLKRAGVGFVRVQLKWPQLEPELGRRDYSALDTWAKAVGAAGLPLLVTVTDAPAWLGGHSPAEANYLTMFLGAAAGHLGKQALAWEVWRQPNTSRYWPPEPQPFGFRMMLGEIKDRLKNVEGKPLLLNGALRGWDPSFVGTMLGGDTPGIDRLAVTIPVPRNAYPFLGADQAPSKALLEILGAAQQWMTQPGKPKLGVWAMDVGVRSSPLEESKIGQARELARCAATALGYGGALVWRRALDGVERNDRYGLLRDDLEPKPALAALAGAAASAYGAVRLGPSNLGAGKHAWLVSRGGFMAIAWAETDGDLPAFAEPVTVTDMWGNVVDATAKLGPCPLYIKGGAVAKAFPMGG